MKDGSYVGNIGSYCSTIDKLCKEGILREPTKNWHQMDEHGCKRSVQTYISLINSFVSQAL